MERDIDGLEWKFGRSQTVRSSGREQRGRVLLTVATILRACTAQGIDPSILWHADLLCKVRRCEDDGSGEVDGVEGVHEQRICNGQEESHVCVMTNMESRPSDSSWSQSQ
jgi:hypothetical protein